MKQKAKKEFYLPGAEFIKDISPNNSQITIVSKNIAGQEVITHFEFELHSLEYGTILSRYGSNWP